MQIVFVTGMHRSGTSSIAGELVNAGLSAPTDLLAADRDNPKGYFESNSVVALNEAILSSIGSNWMDPADFPSDWLSRVSDAGFLQAAVDLLNAVKRDGESVVLKDPRFSRLIPLWEKAARAAEIEFSFVHVFRSCISVAQSLNARNNIPPGHSFQLWARYNIDALEAFQECKHVIISYDRIIEDASILNEAVIWLNLKNIDHAKIGSFIDPSLDHSVLQEEFKAQLPQKFMLPFLGDSASLDLHNLRALFEMAGGEPIAIERRHYGVIHSTLWTVVDELKQSRKKIDELTGLLQERETSAPDDAGSVTDRK